MVEQVLADRSYDNVPFSRILRMIERHRGVERVRERAVHFTEKAKAIIAEFPDSPYQRALTAVTGLVIDRDR